MWGYGVLHFVAKAVRYRKWTLDLTLTAGLCALAVYAQLFSLFYKVGVLAFALMLLADAVLLLFMRRDMIIWWKERVLGRYVRHELVMIFILGVFALIMSSASVKQGDSYLYHAQAIEWIEEYGVVPGLGNLHNRLAYNSSFLCLQALFGMKFIFGQSMHSLNGFICLLMLGYAVNSMKFWRTKKFHISDFMRLAVIMYFGEGKNAGWMSSPGTDLFALGLVLYILSKWIDILEDSERETAPYAVLCVLGLFAATVKLSAGMIVLLALYPAYDLISKKRWRETMFFLLLGIATVGPFLARNVLICGYLVYPYPELDLFSVDWKMPAYTLLHDRNEIKAWGWGLNDVTRFNALFDEWFPVWKESLGRVRYWTLRLNILLTILAVPGGVILGIRKRGWHFLHIVMTIWGCLLLWFFGAPLPRYGEIFLILLPLFCAGAAFQRIEARAKPGNLALVVMVILGTFYIAPLVNSGMQTQWSYKIRCADYDYYDISLSENLLDHQIIYTPNWGDATGYYGFPSTPYVSKLDVIELRGESFADGFRMKAEYRDAYISGSGRIYEDNMFVNH